MMMIAFDPTNRSLTRENFETATTIDVLPIHYLEGQRALSEGEGQPVHI